MAQKTAAELVEKTNPSANALVVVSDGGVSYKVKKSNLAPSIPGPQGEPGEPGASAAVFVSVGPTGSGADYIVDGTDDNIQIQAALDSVPDGATVFLLPFLYDIDAPIIVDILKGLHFMGSGWGTILKAKNGLNDYVIKFDTTDAGIWAKFSNFKIEGNASNQTAGGGIYAEGSLECTFDNIWVHQAYNWGIFLYSISESPLNYGHNNRIINSVFDEGDDSPGIGGGVYMEHNDENHITNCDFQFMGGAGARADGLADGYAIFDKAGLNTITGNAIVNCYNGIMVRDAGNTVVANNVFDRMRYVSLMLRGRQNTVRDNIFYQMGANTGLTNEAIGIWIEYYNSQSIDGNWFISDGSAGVTRCFIRDHSDATGGGDSQFTNNYFFVDGSLGTGIFEITGASKRNYFANNHGNTIAGSGQLTKTTTYTVTPLDKIIGCNSTGGAFTITLPAAAYSYQKLTVVLDVDAGDITIARGSGDTIGGVAANKTLADAGDSITLESDGVTNWRVTSTVGL